MQFTIKGIKGKDFIINKNDNLAKKMAMLIEGHCTIGVQQAIKKYGYSEQRYYQLLKQYNKGGSEALIDKKRGAKGPSVRKWDTVKQIIRFRFLDPFSSAEVISQKLRQIGHKVSTRSVERTITEYGLQKKRMSSTPRKSGRNKK